jgi:hypothetical protein
MTFAELLSAVDAALRDGPAPGTLERLSRAAQQVADMTGWAPGVIDLHGRIDDALLRLQDQAKTLYLRDHDGGAAALHDALADLRQAIASHDLQWTAPPDDGDDDAISS